MWNFSQDLKRLCQKHHLGQHCLVESFKNSVDLVFSGDYSEREKLSYLVTESFIGAIRDLTLKYKLEHYIDDERWSFRKN